MEKEYLVYYDSGTSNSRIYLLDRDFQIQYTEKKNIGSKDSSIAGDNIVLIRGLKELYDGMLQATGIEESRIEEDIYASGMVTSPYGLKEIPHLVIPTTVERFAESVYCFREDKVFHRNFHLIPGLKTTGDNVTMVNNMRGEEIEIIGTLDTLQARYPGRKIALILPGSHTHTALIQDQKVQGILSSMTGELFYALRTSTILSPILGAGGDILDKKMVREGVRNLETYGFNRAIYICHAMRLFNEGTPAQQKSYAEGVMNGGFSKALSWYCERDWKGCDLAVVVSNPYMYELYSTLLEGHPHIKEVDWLPISKQKSYAIDGLKKILSCTAAHS